MAANLGSGMDDPIGQAYARWAPQSPLSPDAMAAQRERLARYGMPLQDSSPHAYAGMQGQPQAPQYSPATGDQPPGVSYGYGGSGSGSGSSLLGGIGDAQKAIWGGLRQIPGAINWLGQKLG